MIIALARRCLWRLCPIQFHELYFENYGIYNDIGFAFLLAVSATSISTGQCLDELQRFQVILAEKNDRLLQDGYWEETSDEKVTRIE